MGGLRWFSNPTKKKKKTPQPTTQPNYISPIRTIGEALGRDWWGDVGIGKAEVI